MVTRRRLLLTAAGSSAAFLSGCVRGSDDTYPVNVTVQNASAERFSVEVVLENDDGDTLFEGEFDVPEPESDRHLMTLRDVARVPDGERVQAQVHVDGETHEVRQEVTCSGGTPDNVFRFVIYPDGRMELQTLSDGRAGEEC